MASKDQMAQCWVVKLEGRCPAYVIAKDWEQATVEAARFWGISWTANVANMDLLEKLEARKNVCLKCGKFFYGTSESGLCQRCETARQQDIERAKALKRKTWYLGRKNSAFGS